MPSIAQCLSLVLFGTGIIRPTHDGAAVRIFFVPMPRLGSTAATEPHAGLSLVRITAALTAGAADEPAESREARSTQTR